MISLKNLTAKDIVETALAAVAIVVSIFAICYSCQANSLSRQSNSLSQDANNTAADANKLAHQVAAVQGDVLVMDSPVVTLWDPSKNDWARYTGAAGPTLIPAEAWSASPPDRRTLTVRLTNNGQQDAHIAQWGFVTRPATLIAGPIQKFPPRPDVSTTFDDAAALNATCSRGAGDPGGACQEILAPHAAEMITVAIPDGYLHEVAEELRPYGIVFSLYVAGQEQTFPTKLVLPAVAFGE